MSDSLRIIEEIIKYSRFKYDIQRNIVFDAFYDLESRKNWNHKIDKYKFRKILQL